MRTDGSTRNSTGLLGEGIFDRALPQAAAFREADQQPTGEAEHSRLAIRRSGRAALDQLIDQMGSARPAEKHFFAIDGTSLH